MHYTILGEHAHKVSDGRHATNYNSFPNMQQRDGCDVCCVKFKGGSLSLIM